MLRAFVSVFWLLTGTRWNRCGKSCSRVTESATRILFWRCLQYLLCFPRSVIEKSGASVRRKCDPAQALRGHRQSMLADSAYFGNVIRYLVENCAEQWHARQ